MSTDAPQCQNQHGQQRLVVCRDHLHHFSIFTDKHTKSSNSLALRSFLDLNSVKVWYWALNVAALTCYCSFIILHLTLPAMFQNHIFSINFNWVPLSMSIYGFSLRFILHAKRQEQFPFDGSLSFPYFYDNLMQYYTIQNFYLIDKKILWGFGWSSRYSWGANSRFFPKRLLYIDACDLLLSHDVQFWLVGTPPQHWRLGKALETGPNLFFTPSIKHNTHIYQKKKTLSSILFF
jgi:hypothetical protein